MRGKGIVAIKLMIANPKLLAAVAHEGAIKPKNNEKYRKILEQRRLESEQTKRWVVGNELLADCRPIIQLESTGIRKSELNRLASGYSNANSRFGKGFIVSLPKRARLTSRPLVKTRQGNDMLVWMKSNSPVDYLNVSTINLIGVSRRSKLYYSNLISGYVKC